MFSARISSNESGWSDFDRPLEIFDAAQVAVQRPRDAPSVQRVCLEILELQPRGEREGLVGNANGLIRLVGDHVEASPIREDGRL